MGEALLAGLLDAEWCGPGDVVIVEAVAERRAELADRFAGVTVTDRPTAADGAVIAVKPPDVSAACEAVAAERCPRVLSIAAGIPLVALEARLGTDVAVVRAMPNTPSLVGAGAAAIAPGTAAGEDDLAWAEEILGAVGVVVRLPEAQLDAVTGLSGSGPAYLFLVAEALIEAGVHVGLPRATAELLANQTLLGAGRLLIESGDPAAELRAAVTSPGGTTASGLYVLEDRRLRAALIDAVRAATERSRELGAS